MINGLIMYALWTLAAGLLALLIKIGDWRAKPRKR